MTTADRVSHVVRVSPSAALDLDALSAAARALDGASDNYLLVLGDDYTSGQNAVTLAAWLAPQTTRLRIVPEVPVTHTEPFHVATSTATLDYAATGRAGWSPVAQISDAAADVIGRRDPRRSHPPLHRPGQGPLRRRHRHRLGRTTVVGQGTVHRAAAPAG